jgi:hypothetical protein
MTITGQLLVLRTNHESAALLMSIYCFGHDQSTGSGVQIMFFAVHWGVARNLKWASMERVRSVWASEWVFGYWDRASGQVDGHRLDSDQEKT